jgi:hypothetical protein
MNLPQLINVRGIQACAGPMQTRGFRRSHGIPSAHPDQRLGWLFQAAMPETAVVSSRL